MRNDVTKESSVAKKSKVIKETDIPVESSDTSSTLLVKKDLVLSNGQEISILFCCGKAACFRQNKLSNWEPIGEENWNLAMAMNQLEEEIKPKD